MELVRKPVSCTFCGGQGHYEEQLENYAGSIFKECDECKGEGTTLEYSTEDLWQACQHHGLDVQYSSHKQILRMRCIMALRHHKLLD